MVSFIRPATQIPSADTLRRDISDNFKTAKDNFRLELQVGDFITFNNLDLIFY